ncbi:MAG: vitamin B12 dependent-methionine synthase activation domain-containing protein [Nocardioides sp.]
MVFHDDRRGSERARVHQLRQQGAHREGVPNKSLADFVAPVASGVADHLGAFAVTAGHGMRERVEAFKAAHDDYSAILLEALADRLAEAFAELLHQRVRTELWGYAADESLAPTELLRERFVGIRPAPGYPACPDHTAKQELWDLLGVAELTGIELTESMAMWPGASVSGWYFAHAEAQYFVVGRLARDQVEDYVKRRGWTLAEGERWLSANLGYDPED